MCAADGSSCATIADQTGSSYTTATADVGSTIRVEVTGSNAGGSNLVTSLQTAGSSEPRAPAAVEAVEAVEAVVAVAGRARSR